MKKAHRKQRGAALIFALTLLALFAVLGTGYVVGMSLRLDDAHLTLRARRAEHLAEAGVRAAIGELSRALAEGRADGLLAQGTLEFQFPAYEGVMTERGYIYEQAPRASFARVQVIDESGKLNLNHAPASMLRLMLNIDGATARKIRGSLPVPRLFEDQTAASEKRWLAGVDELVSRGFLTQEQLDRVDPALFTTYTVSDHAKPERFLNVNAAPAPVLAALFDVPLETAEAAMAQRPFLSLADMEAAAGKKAFTFNIKPEPGARDQLPPELALESRCFRLVSRGTYGLEGQAVARRSSALAEAVVVFHTHGGYTITYWSADAGMEEAEPVERVAIAGPEMQESAGAGAPEVTQDEQAPAGDPAAQP